jgi:tetratricopeptide (TPR) repeat protein
MIVYARDFLKTEDNPKYLAFAEYCLGRIYQVQGKNEQALNLYLDAKSNAESSDNDDIKCVIRCHIGYLYYMQRQYEYAIDNFKQALVYYNKSQGNNKRKINILNIAGNCFLMRNMRDSAMICYHKALQSAITAQDSCDIIQNSGVMYLMKKDIDMAKQKFQQALNLTQDSVSQCLIYSNLAKVYEYEEIIDSAIYFAQLSLKYAKNDNYTLCNIYNTLSNMEREKGNYKQVDEYHTRYIEHIMAINNEKNNMPDIQLFEEKHNSDILKSKNNSLGTKIKWLLISVFLLLIITGIFSGCLYLVKNEIIRLKKKITELDKKVVESRKKLSDYFELMQNNIKKIAVFHYCVYLINKKTDNQKFLQSIKTLSIFENKGGNLYDDINMLHNGLFDKIKNKYQEINDIELKIICLTCLDFDNFDISELVGIEKHIVERKKSEIRKLLKLNRGGDIKIFILDSLQ